MKIFYCARVFLSLVVIFFFTSFALAEEIDFSDENVASDILLEKSWTCQEEGKGGKDITVFTFNSVKGNKTKGLIDVQVVPACYYEKFTGKIKQNRVTFAARTTSICGNMTGKIEFFYDESGNLKAAGSSRNAAGNYQSTFICE